MTVAVVRSAAVGAPFWRSNVPKCFFGAILFLYWGLHTREVVLVAMATEWVRFEHSGSANFCPIWTKLVWSVADVVTVAVA